jgi:hypothetical protein
MQYRHIYEFEWLTEFIVVLQLATTSDNTLS